MTKKSKEMETFSNQYLDDLLIDELKSLILKVSDLGMPTTQITKHLICFGTSMSLLSTDPLTAIHHVMEYVSSTLEEHHDKEDKNNE